ncbi:MAG: M23 family metallopeptidase [Anaerolineales bacterium]
MEPKIQFEDGAARGRPAESAKPESRQEPADSRMGPIQLHWPTDYRVITQAFGDNPDLVAHRKLPGHEGLDIRAPLDSRVYACADGVVENVQDRFQDGDAYGRWISIRHSGGYRTLYGHLSKTSVNKGSKVTARQAIGVAGPTGATAGGHIHLSLMWEGATAGGLTQYPDNLIDPTPFLLVSPVPKDTITYPWPIGRCLLGTSMQTDGMKGNPITLEGSPNQPEAVQLSLQNSAGQIANLRKTRPEVFLLTTLRLPFKQGLAPREWVAQVSPMMKTQTEAGISYFEVLSSPNLASEGCFSAWQSGGEFARWWIDVTTLLKENFPLGRFGFPGLATGPQVYGQRMDAQIFMEQADEAMLVADWIGVHCTWANSEEMLDEELGARERLMRRWYPDKLLFITEAGSSDPRANAQSRSQEQAAFFTRMQQTPGVGVAFFRST